MEKPTNQAQICRSKLCSAASKLSESGEFLNSLSPEHAKNIKQASAMVVKTLVQLDIIERRAETTANYRGAFRL